MFLLLRDFKKISKATKSGTLSLKMLTNVITSCVNSARLLKFCEFWKPKRWYLMIPSALRLEVLKERLIELAEYFNIFIFTIRFFQINRVFKTTTGIVYLLFISFLQVLKIWKETSRCFALFWAPRLYEELCSIKNI